ncbi:flavin-containing monooxygenase [Ornithinimicrobium cryptoxanthini]|uniref:flavin-containing monooxygenase n=1 Tax=Ornithinimicrobium cryptoxanthini TaxID=2934161 RepID=UPI002119A3EC|nr:NAD(P)/FAD-dependent oxidoreductase [Ornithinimicrobium cryptoxanthini]
MSTTSPPPVVDTVIIGAGQAGLATAYHLTRHGRGCLVLDSSRRVGDNWRHQYDSLRLFTANRYNGLPGMPFPGRGWDFATKDETADYLEAYAAGFRLPVELATGVTHLGAREDGFTVDTTRGTIRCRDVVVASGPFGRTPSVPALAADLDESILQLHSSAYRRPGQLRDGPTLVVGASHSGHDIALEVSDTHPTTLAGRDRGEIPVSWDSPMLHVVMPVLQFAFRHVFTRNTPMGRRQRPQVLAHGAPNLRVKRAHLAQAGVVRTEARVTGARDGLPLLEDGSTVEASNVVWATGYQHDYSWLDLPVLDESGWPREFRGVARDVPGLFFCGLAYQHSFASMTLPGVGRDAAYVARKILERGEVTPVAAITTAAA